MWVKLLNRYKQKKRIKVEFFNFKQNLLLEILLLFN